MKREPKYFIEKEERIKVLQAALKRLITGDTDRYICILIASVLLARKITKEYAGSDVATKYFPELLKYKPKYNCKEGGWWAYRNVRTRAKVLNEIIKEIKNS